MIYIPKHFKIEELVPPEYMSKYTPYQLWMMFDSRILKGADMLRERHGSMTINNWLWGGDYKYSGIRPESWYKGPSASQHRFGRALDPKFKKSTPQEVRQDIKNNIMLFGDFIKRVEKDTPTWVHIDTGQNENGIKFFDP